MRFNEIKNSLVPNPFTNSKMPYPLYHGTNSKFDKFLRPAHGVYITPSESWAKNHYGNNIICLYANVTKLYRASFKEAAPFYDLDYDAVSAFLNKLSKQNYNACLFGGESDSTVLFNNIEIINATNGKSM
jgi:hypothetical protein